MDFGTLLNDVQSLKDQFLLDAQKQSDALLALKDSLDQHYTGVQQQIETFQTAQEEAVRRQAAEQNEAIDVLRQSQTACTQEQQELHEQFESIGRIQNEQSTAIESARQTAREAANLAAAQASEIVEAKQSAEEGLRSLKDASSASQEKLNAQLDELRSALARQDQAKLLAELQQKVDAFQGDTVNSVRNLGGLVDKQKIQIEQIKENQRASGRMRDDIDRLAQRADDLEKSATKMRGKIREMESREGGPQAGFREGGGSGSGGGRLLSWIAIALSVIAIAGLAAGGVYLKQSQDIATAELQQQIIRSRDDSSAQLADLDDQLKELTAVVEATPTPTPEPTATPVPTPDPSATAEDETPKP